MFCYAYVLSRGTVVIEEAFSPTKTLAQIAATESTIFFGVPSMYTIILNTPEFKEHSFKHLRLLCYGLPQCLMSS